MRYLKSSTIQDSIALSWSTTFHCCELETHSCIPRLFSQSESQVPTLEQQPLLSQDGVLRKYEETIADQWEHGPNL